MARVAEADAAKQAEAEAEQELDDFRTTGARRRFVDNFNATRKAKLGELSKFQHEHPELNLPSDWAESFFKSAPALRELSPKVLANRIEATRAELRRLEAIRDGRAVREAKEEALRKQAEKEALQTEIAVKKETAAKVLAEAEALQAELDKLDK